MPRDDRDPLRGLLKRLASELSEKAVSSDERISREDVEALEPLARLIEIRDAARESRRRAVILLLLGTLAFVSVLVFVRVSNTEIELDLEVSELSFVLPVDQPITEAIDVTSLGVSGVTAIEIPHSSNLSGATYDAANVLLSPGSADDHTGTINLAAITLAAGSRVWLRATGQPQEYRLSFRGGTSALSVSLDGPVDIVVPGARSGRLDFPVPRQLALRTGPEVVDLEFTITPGSRTVFSTQLPAENLHLFRIDEYTGPGGGTVVRQVSTVRSGTLYMESIDGRALHLRPGEGIRFGRSSGEIRQLELAEDHLVTKFHGRVRDMTSGSGEVRRSMMPSLLEWLRARQGLALLWGTTAYVFGLAAAALRWWRRSA